MSSTLEIVGLTALWSLLATALVFLPGVPLAYLLARKEFPGKKVISTLTSLPMVLPPTAVGFLLLQVLADRGPLGREQLGFDLDILFTWKAVVLACAVMAAPLVLRTARVSFEAVDPKLESMARTLGYGRFKTFCLITLPLAWRGLLAAAILGFSRSLGEFGATVMIAGNIPGRTQTLSSAIFSAQQSGQADHAIGLVWVALAVGFVAIFSTEILLSGRGRKGRSA
jgi:molybdate transport system permease protein